ncbi:GspH/FimT family pseudopilin [Pseudomonadota bacterium]
MTKLIGRTELNNHRCTGFTLVELMMVLAIASILVTVGIPSFMNVSASNKVTTASNGMVSMLNLAKSEAIHSGSTVALCKLNTAGTACDSSANWSQGSLLFSDSDGDATLDPGERVIRIQPAPDANLNFTFVRTGGADGDSGNSNASTANVLVFTSRGRSLAEGRFCYENPHDAANSRAVEIKLSGHFSTQKRSSSSNCSS